MTPARETVRAARAWLPGGLAHDVAIELDGARVVAVREGRRGDGLPLPGLLLPGLINAHTHAELHDRRPAPDRPARKRPATAIPARRRISGPSWALSLGADIARPWPFGQFRPRLTAQMPMFPFISSLLHMA